MRVFRKSETLILLYSPLGRGWGWVVLLRQQVETAVEKALDKKGGNK